MVDEYRNTCLRILIPSHSSDSSMVDEYAGEKPEQTDKRLRSDSSMVDEYHWLTGKRNYLSLVQIPLWSMNTANARQV